MRLWIAVPSSLVEDAASKDERTRKVGLVARAAAIFRAEKVFVFRDPLSERPHDADFIARVLEYAATPPYLRRKLFPIAEDLEKVGLLHPLGIPPHRRSRELRPGEVREGVLELVGGRLYADVGVGRLIEYVGRGQAGHRVTVTVRERNGDYYCEESSPSEYWGFSVSVVDVLPKLVRSARPSHFVVTSRLGIPLSEAWDRVAGIASSDGTVLVAFGSRRGLLEMHERREYESLGALIANFIPGQGVETVRTEEAMIAVLAILNALAAAAPRRVPPGA
ncbi:MAG: putative RNA uridine N3 methyltransferase [Conexivisphaera sp.]